MNTTTPKAFAFVLMPFQKRFNDLYKFGIKGACADAGCYCERVDEQIFMESILERVYNQIFKADLIIADMSERNANVFYEVGYAHALGKKVILLTENSDDIPFDLKHFSHIVYNGQIEKLKNELYEKIRWVLAQQDVKVSELLSNVRFYYYGNEIVDYPEFLYEGKDTSSNSLRLVFDIHNNTEKIVEKVSFQIGLVSSPRIENSRIPKSTTGRTIKLPTKNYLHQYDHIFTILPGSWARVAFNLLSKKKLLSEELLDFAVRVFTDFGSKDYPFKLRTQFSSSDSGQ